MTDSAWLKIRVAAVAALTLLAAYAGLLIGEWSISESKPPVTAGAPAAGSAAASASHKLPEPPVFFFPNVSPEGDWKPALEQIRMAADVGVKQYVVPVGLPWNESSAAVQVAVDRLKSVCQKAQQANILLYVRLDPPESWRTAHPDEVAPSGDKPAAFASIGSRVWAEDAQRCFTTLWNGMKESGVSDSVSGCIVAALDGGMWRQGPGYDSSPANTACYREWLRRQYATDQALRAAWGDDAISLDAAAPPPEPDRANTHEVFFAPGQAARQSDFVRYLSEQTADAIAASASHIKAAMGENAQTIACYGETFEALHAVAGQSGLLRLLDAGVDGIAAPVSYTDRGLGGAGGPMGAVDSIVRHGKRFYLIDDTRTGVAPAAPDAKDRTEGLRLEDVYSVQRRNFAFALAHGFGLIWTDPEGQGSFGVPEIWSHFGKMYTLYKESEAEAGPSEEGQTPQEAWPPEKDFLLAVVDEDSSALLQCDAELNKRLLLQARDTVLRAGVPARFYLLQDVLEGRAPNAGAYLFLNVFQLKESERTKLHQILAANSALAIWMYAPGYVSDTASVENIGATVRMKVAAFDKPTAGTSVYQLGGVWMAKDETFGDATEWFPLFYVEDEGVDVLALYKTANHASTAIAFFEEGWASIFVGEPALTPSLLRELLHLSDMHVYFPSTRLKYYDVAYFGSRVVAIHGKEAGERVVDFGDDRAWDVQDLLAPDIGWLKKNAIVLPLRTGDTRLLKLTHRYGGASE